MAFDPTRFCLGSFDLAVGLLFFFFFFFFSGGLLVPPRSRRSGFRPSCCRSMYPATRSTRAPEPVICGRSGGMGGGVAQGNSRSSIGRTSKLRNK